MVGVRVTEVVGGAIEEARKGCAKRIRRINYTGDTSNLYITINIRCRGQ
jgi:hypothetical protein